MLSSVPAELAWGLAVRGIGLTYLIAFWSLRSQVLGWCGSRGITPIALQLRAARRDFPGPRRFLYFPTLLWIASGDRALERWLTLGMGLASLVVIGGPWSWFALLGCVLIYLSFDHAGDMIYPWDCLLLEAGALALLLPQAELLPTVSLVAAPHPAASFALRLLLFRVLFGFGRYKFFGPGELHGNYLKSFLVTQPLPTPLGRRAQQLPSAVHRVALGALFVAEVLAPFGFFVPGPTRVVAACVAIGLMLVIQSSGSFGFFNLIVAVLAIGLFDAESTVMDVFSSAPSSVGDAAVLGLVALHTLLALSLLPFNSWIGRAWPYWPSFAEAKAAPVRWFAAVHRALVPFHVVHAYGVFSPESGPPVQWVPVIEGSQDGVRWERYRYAFRPVDEDSPLYFVAPRMPRLDHFTIYEAYGISMSNYYASIFAIGTPYRFSRHSLMDRLLERLLEASPDVRGLFAHAPFGEEGPAMVRVRLRMLTPVHGSTRWRAEDLVTIKPARGRRGVFDEWPSSPDEFHPDDRVWRRRARGGEAAADEADESASVPLSGELSSLSWSELPRAAEELAADERAALRRAVAARVERLRLRLPSARELGCESELELHLALRGWVHRPAPQGRLRDALACDTDALIDEGLKGLALLEPEQLAFHACKARIAEMTLRGAGRRPPKIAPGALRVIPRLGSRWPAAEDERLPSFHRDSRGEWVRSHCPSAAHATTSPGELTTRQPAAGPGQAR